jgi:predicted GH43/DUF377 family glycosyl hydrolase
MSAYGYKLVEVTGMDGFKYTNPGGFVRRDGREYVIARRNRAEVDMSTEAAKQSDVVLLLRHTQRLLVDTDEVVLAADPERGIGYEDPRLLLDGSGFTLTLVTASGYRSWLVEMSKGYRGRKMFPIGPRGPVSKNGFMFTSRGGKTVVVSRMCETRSIQFYAFDTVVQAEMFCQEDLPLESWERYQVGVVETPEWSEGDKGRFHHAGFGTMVAPNVAVVHFARSNESGKYYVTALQQIDDGGVPVGPPQLVAEPAANLPHGDVPNVIYTMMAWVEGSEVVMWSGHDDTNIVECRAKLPKWAVREISRR